MQFNKVAFIGLGLIGGSIAKKIKKIYPESVIIATAHRDETIQSAFQLGLISNSTKPAIEDLAGCDTIFLCAPVKNNIEYLSMLKGLIRKDTIITDVGSTKTQIHLEINKLGLDKNFIGGHPMTGSEKTGILNSDDLLLENAYYIITPSETVAQQHVEDYHNFVRQLGSIPLILDYRKHDYATASISHLPHMISYALTSMVSDIDTDETMKTIAAGGFRDMTRIAASSPAMWESICLSNKDQIVDLTDKYIEELTKLKALISSSKSQELYSYFQNAKNYRDSLHLPAKRFKSDFFELFVDLEDEAGGIAIIASLLAFKNINIKNIGIINNREFEEGVLRIEFYDQNALDKAIDILQNKNYTVHLR